MTEVGASMLEVDWSRVIKIQKAKVQSHKPSSARLYDRY